MSARKHTVSLFLFVLLLLPAIGRGAVTPTKKADEKKPPESFADILTRVNADVAARQSEFHALMNSRQNDFGNRVATAHDDFENQLKNVKDDRRRQIVERINDKMQDVLKNAIDRFTDSADTFDGIFGHLQTWHDQAVAAGLNVSSTDVVMNAAHTSIVTTRADIAGLLSKTYLIAVSGDTTLNADVGAARDIMRNDFLGVRRDLQSTRDALQAALQALQNVPGIADMTDPMLGIASSTASSTILDASSTTNTTSSE